MAHETKNIYSLAPNRINLLIAGPQASSEEGVRKEGEKDSTGLFKAIPPRRSLKKLLLSFFVCLPCFVLMKSGSRKTKLCGRKNVAFLSSTSPYLLIHIQTLLSSLVGMAPLSPASGRGIWGSRASFEEMGGQKGLDPQIRMHLLQVLHMFHGLRFAVKGMFPIEADCLPKHTAFQSTSWGLPPVLSSLGVRCLYPSHDLFIFHSGALVFAEASWLTVSRFPF